MQPERINSREFKNGGGGNGGTFLAIGLGAAAVIGAVGYGVYSLFNGRPMPEQPHQYRYGENRSKNGSALMCAICLENLSFSEMKHLKCGHGFHKNCIAEWFAKEGYTHTCPCCRNRHMSF